jgi:nicotinate-nucleotide adenylyltransferase
MSQAAGAPLILVGGTFDPPHIGHLVLAECAHAMFGGNVIFLPAGDPWRKAADEAAPHHVSPVTHRLAMTRLAIGDNPRFKLDDRETRRSGRTYTVDTLEELRSEGHCDLVLVLGADALDDLPNWKSPARIRELATLAVAPRAEAAFPKDDTIVMIDMPPLAISATDIRERVAAGKPIRYLVPGAVEAYIGEHGLYRV